MLKQNKTDHTIYQRHPRVLQLVYRGAAKNSNILTEMTRSLHDPFNNACVDAMLLLLKS